MWYSAVGCIMMLTLSLLTAPLAADVQQPGNRLRVFRIANTVSLGRGVGQERWLRMRLSENYVAL